MLHCTEAKLINCFYSPKTTHFLSFKKCVTELYYYFSRVSNRPTVIYNLAFGVCLEKLHCIFISLSFLFIFFQWPHRTQNTPGTVTKRKGKEPTVEQHVVVDLSTEEEDDSSNQASDDEVTGVGQSGSLLLKKARFAIKLSSKAYEARYHKFNIGHHMIIFGESILGYLFKTWV